MSYDQDSHRKLRYAEERIEMLEKRNAEILSQMRTMAKDRNVDKLNADIERINADIDRINRYDEQVAMITAADPHLQEAWDNFRCLYQLTARKELLTLAREKAAGQADGTCHACKRPVGQDARRMMQV